MNTTNKTAVEVVLETFILRPTTHVNAGDNKTEKAVKLTESQLETIITQAHQQGEREALRNVPVGFVRQWINEDLLKDGHQLVTDEDIQRFINIALQEPLVDKESLMETKTICNHPTCLASHGGEVHLKKDCACSIYCCHDKTPEIVLGLGKDSPLLRKDTQDTTNDIATKIVLELRKNNIDCIHTERAIVKKILSNLKNKTQNVEEVVEEMRCHEDTLFVLERCRAKYGDVAVDHMWETIEYITKQALQKERQHADERVEAERGRIRKFLEESSVWDSKYIYTRKVRMLEQFDDKFTNNNKHL